MSQVATDLPVIPIEPDSSTSNHAADRLGVVASVLCAIHCAATPFLLLMLPAFGKAWSHPATHWGMALLVVPLAGFMIRSSYRKYGRKWIVGAGSAGILFILCGAAAPYVEQPPGSTAAAEAEGAAPDQDAVVADDEDPCEGCELCEANKAGEESDAEVCTDNCCPSLQEAEDGSWTLNIPTASILTTLGGAFLIATHIGNIRLCQCCDGSSTECEATADGESTEE